MKNGRIQLLVLITCIFAAFTLGLFAGRNFNRTPVTIQAVTPTGAAVINPTTPAVTEPQWPIDLNTATQEQLQLLPGIGPVLAQRILAYRDAYGPFSSVGELGNVKGIGESKLEEVWDYVTAGG